MARCRGSRQFPINHSFPHLRPADYEKAKITFDSRSFLIRRNGCVGHHLHSVIQLCVDTSGLYFSITANEFKIELNKLALS